MIRSSACCAAAFALALTPEGARAQSGEGAPLSAIDWLAQPDGPQSLPGGGSRRPDGGAWRPSAALGAGEPPVAGAVSIPDIEVTPLAAATSGAVGLLPPSVTGLPADMWAQSTATALSDLWGRASQAPMPAIAALYHTLLLAEAEPPQGPEGAYLRSRVEMLRRLGAVEPALELLERAGPFTPELFPAWFELALLSGAESEACAALSKAPSLLSDDGARIYCATLTGDWPTAALLFDTGAALGTLRGTEAVLLEQFLDPELAEEAEPPIPSAAPSPLEFRLFEAIGAPLPTLGLPTAYAMADLRGTVGWKAEIEAAERLARVGALAPNRLMGLYTRQSASASGGVWDRVSAVQDLDEALARGDLAASGAALEAAWRLMRDEGLEMPFAQIVAGRIEPGGLPHTSADLAFRLALLTPDYEAAAAEAPPGREAQFLAGLARGRPDTALANDPDQAMIAAAFSEAPEAAPEHALLIEKGRLGEAILSAALQFDRASGDPGEMASALRSFRAVGLEDTARRAALQALILGRDS
ncbi:hypothetical protein [Roseovarius aquimarinus]|uniref:Tetratricopeptide repeat protein n=1 Tax=Roseovarius aquimarinus TaxID=1229156 RepID=A0ABW7I3D7_9RHOB